MRACGATLGQESAQPLQELLLRGGGGRGREDRVVAGDRADELGEAGVIERDGDGLRRSDGRGDHGEVRAGGAQVANEEGDACELVAQVARHRRLRRRHAALLEPGEELVLARDVTQLNRLLSTRQDFVANVSHELRTPLTVIIGYLEALEDASVGEADMREILGRLAPPARRMKALVGHVAVVRGAAFSADGRWIATAGPTRAGLWELRPSSLVDSRLYYLSGHRGAIAAVVFAGSGWRIFSGGSDGTLRRYDCRLCTDTEGLRRIAARKLARLEDDKKR